MARVVAKQRPKGWAIESGTSQPIVAAQAAMLAAIVVERRAGWVRAWVKVTEALHLFVVALPGNWGVHRRRLRPCPIFSLQ